MLAIEKSLYARQMRKTELKVFGEEKRESPNRVFKENPAKTRQTEPDQGSSLTLITYKTSLVRYRVIP